MSPPIDLEVILLKHLFILCDSLYIETSRVVDFDFVLRRHQNSLAAALIFSSQLQPTCIGKATHSR